MEGRMSEPCVSNYYDGWQEKTYVCRHCGWAGPGKALERGDRFAALFELDCPRCHGRLLTVSYPTLAESRANWDKVAEADKRAVEIIEARSAEFERRALRRPDQLPDIEGPPFFLIWDQSEEAFGDLRILRGSRIIHSEPGFYDYYERYIEIAQIVRQKYGERVLDLEPTERSKLSLYGDRLASIGIVANARRRIFGRES
jgi:hypothetical protein